MHVPAFDALAVGDSLPALRIPPISRKTLALYAGASADHHPMHIDLDYARASGAPDVFAHGMLSAAYVGRMLTDWVPQQRIRRLAVRFTGIMPLQAEPLCSARIAEKMLEDGEQRVRVTLNCVDQHGASKIVGEAVIALD
ncbi:MaoC-like protein [Bordetella bronchiseptica GA96-01]|uniref:MaoC/PaaZ C-terminal domain-containing protein n=1 Tax=Bordetella bronchiseptica TaxID=518 RepID=UPI00045B8171|nr:MaoC/PaaZ C-terminal domain-containing protein [Bordetella bronchiseptica]AZW29677.1 dehydratase [Bordetella bronchiseptica]KCV45847.1 MaoC-like protein [Bordetella bronchiseptica 345]KDC41712.1 MaoC-like protein [Bordetella bronchiseptica GA96-01]